MPSSGGNSLSGVFDPDRGRRSAPCARERFGVLGIAVEAEKDVRVVLVSSDQRDVVFEAMYKAGGLDRPGAGVMYVTPVDRVATYIPDLVIDRLKEAGQWNPAS